MQFIIDNNVDLFINKGQQFEDLKMGNKGSEFETEFYKRYSFIQTIDDRLFGMVKIYRKNTVKFDYIMIMQVQIQELPQNEIQVLEDRLRQVRSFQNQTTLRIYHYKFLAPVKIQCRNKRLLIYAQYMNRSLFDYLCALRSNPKFIFQTNQIIYVLRNISKSCIALKKMNIKNLDMSSKKIFLSPEGEALLCPLLYILASMKGTAYYNQVHCLQNRYQKYSITYLPHPNSLNPFPLRSQFTNLLLEMTGNLSPSKINQTNFLYNIIQHSPNLQALYSNLPQIQIQTIQIQQMHRMQNMSGQFYDVN